MAKTIYALATPPGRGSIAIVRISGPEAKSVLSAVFTGQIADHQLCYGKLWDKDRLIDQCMAVYFAAPRTYTREDMAEIHVHGGLAVVRETLNLLSKHGLVQAQPGEFTKRAFLNGRVDLSQAEAVMDMISAESSRYQQVAVQQLTGSVEQLVQGYIDRILDLLAKLNVCVDYPEEDMETTTLQRAKDELNALISDLRASVSSRVAGRVLSQGYRIAIAGRPNVGKSSLLNGILGADRVIVTNIPGTTRDVLRECYTYKDMLFTFMDTAGIRQAEDTVEKLGIAKSYDAMKEADLVLLVLDGSQPLTDEDQVLQKQVAAYPHKVVINKCDLGNRTGKDGMLVSAKEGSNLDHLLEEIYACATQSVGDIGFLTNSRHIAQVDRTVQALTNACHAIEAGQDIACVEIDIRQGWHELGEITGAVCDEQIIDRIFTKFCLGK